LWRVWGVKVFKGLKTKKAILEKIDNLCSIYDKIKLELDGLLLNQNFTNKNKKAIDDVLLKHEKPIKNLEGLEMFNARYDSFPGVIEKVNLIDTVLENPGSDNNDKTKIYEILNSAFLEASSMLHHVFPDIKSQNEFKKNLHGLHLLGLANFYKVINPGALKATDKKIADDLLGYIESTILSTAWKVGFFGGSKVEDSQGKEKKVPHNMKEILKVIRNIKKKDPENKTGQWVAALSYIVFSANKAALNTKTGFFGFGRRDDATQKFYDDVGAAAADQANIPPVLKKT